MEQPSKFQHQLQPDMPSSSTMSTSPHPEQTPPWGALWVLALGLAMIVLDSSIVNVSIPTIIDDIGIDLTDAQWVTSLYNIVLAALLLPFGKLGDAKGRKLVFQIGTVIFVASSLLAATSQDAGMLLTARALQGIGGAMIMPNTLSTVSATFRGKYRAAAFGVWGAVMSSAAALGPLLGGVLTETLGWRWIFLVNLPLGIIIFVATIPLVPKTGGHTSNITSSTASSTIRFQSIDVDIPGVVLSALTSALLVFGLIEGETYGWWKQTSTQLKMGGLTWNHAAVAGADLSGRRYAPAGRLHNRRTCTRQSRATGDAGHDPVPHQDILVGQSVGCGHRRRRVRAGVRASAVSHQRARTRHATGRCDAGVMGLGSIIAGSQAHMLASKFTPVGVVQLGLVIEIIAVA